MSQSIQHGTRQITSGKDWRMRFGNWLISLGERIAQR